MWILLLAMLVPPAISDRASSACIERVVPTHIATRAGHALAASLTLPKQPQGTTVLLIGGAGESDTEYSTYEHNRAYPALAGSMACAGISSLRFDEVGVGASTGSYRRYATTRTLANDVADIVRALSHLLFTRSDHLVLLGHSEGGAIAALVASEDSTVDGVILLAAPVLRGREIVAYQVTRQIQNGMSLAELEATEQRRLARGPWHRYFLDYDPSPTYPNIIQPVLVLQGELDWQVTPAQADSIFALVRSAGKSTITCRKYHDLPHGFNEAEAPFALDRRIMVEVIEWIATIRRSRRAQVAKQECEQR